MDEKNIAEKLLNEKLSENETKTENNTINYKKEIFQWILTVVIAILMASLINTFLFAFVQVEGHSMDNTLNSGERLFLYKLGNYFSGPKKGDIVVIQIQKGSNELMPFLNSGEVDYIKRVVGLPGDKIDIVDGSVYINDKKLDEPFAKGVTRKDDSTKNDSIKIYPLTVPANNIFVMGDNRENSKDSRAIGFISYEKIVGKAIFRVWPLDRIGSLN